MRTKGMTLIELLVVISIIAILSLMLTSVISMVWTSSRATRCGSNMQQISTGLLLFAADNSGYLPPPNDHDYIHPKTQKITGGMNFVMAIKQWVDPWSQVYICPDSNFKKEEIERRWAKYVSDGYPRTSDTDLIRVGYDYSTKTYKNNAGLTGEKSFPKEENANYIGSRCNSSYGMNNQAGSETGKIIGKSTRNIGGGWNSGLAFPDKTAYNIRVPFASRLILVTERVSAGKNTNNEWELVGGVALNGPFKGNSDMSVAKSRVQWEEGLDSPGVPMNPAISDSDSCIRAVHRRKAQMVFFDGHCELKDPVAIWSATEDPYTGKGMQ